MTEKIEENSNFLAQLIRHEGAVKDKNGLHIIYTCPAGHKTIGYGHNLDANPVCGMTEGFRIHEEKAQKLLVEDCAKIAKQLDEALPWWRKKNLPRQAVLLNMAFNMGVAGLLGFRNTLAAVKRGDWESAHDGMLASKWATQVKGRAVELATQMQTGKWQKG